MIALRPYQIEAANAVVDEIAKGNTRTTVVIPTGTGKTTVLAENARRFHETTGKRVVMLAHTNEIMGQIAERVHLHTGDLVGTLGGGGSEYADTAPYVSAMVQTLRNPTRLSLMASTDVGLVIVDECHHAAAVSYQTILGGLGCFAGTPALGFTATLSRGDDKNLADTWQSVAYTKSIKWAIAEGYLCPVRGKSVVLDDLDLAAVKTNAGDYADGSLGEAIAAEVDGIVEAWRTHGEDRKTMAFVPSVEAAEALAAEFACAGISSAVVVGTTPRTMREGIYDAFRDGGIKVLVSVAVLTEGFDMPSVECILMARPTKLQHVYVQAAGRGLRPSPGKVDCLILDVVGVSRMHSLITLPMLDPDAGYERVGVAGDLEPEVEEQIEAEVREQRRQGVEQLDDVDLFAQSDRLWMRTHKGVRFVPCGDSVVFLWPDTETDDEYMVGVMTVKGPRQGGFFHDGGLGGMPSAHRLDLAMARELAEAEAMERGAFAANKGASWRRGKAKPSPAQCTFAKNLGIADPDLFTKARLSDEISIALASRRLDI